MDVLGPVASAQMSGAGGGGAPEWVPDNAKIYIDFVGDRAWTEADGEVAIAALIGSREVAPFDAFDPDDIGVDGLACFGTTSTATALGTLLTKLKTNDWTIVFTWKHSGTQNDYARNLLIGWDENGVGDYGLTIEVRAPSFSDRVRSRDFDGEGPQSIANANTAGGTNILAETFTAEKIAISLNGEAVQSLTSPAPKWSANWLIWNIGKYLGGSGDAQFSLQGYIQSIAVYDPQADEDLPTLSGA